MLKQLNFERIHFGQLIFSSENNEFFIAFLGENNRFFFVEAPDNEIYDSIKKDYYETYFERGFNIYTLVEITSKYSLCKESIKNIESIINGFGHCRASGDILDRIRISQKWSCELFKKCLIKESSFFHELSMFLNKLTSSSIKELTNIPVEYSDFIISKIDEFEANKKIKVFRKKNGCNHIRRIIKSYERYFSYDNELITLES